MKGRKLKLYRCSVCNEIMNTAALYPYRVCDNCIPPSGGAVVDLSAFKESIEEAMKNGLIRPLDGDKKTS